MLHLTVICRLEKSLRPAPPSILGLWRGDYLQENSHHKAKIPNIADWCGDIEQKNAGIIYIFLWLLEVPFLLEGGRF